MKTALIALAMISSAALASPPDYGPGSYTKTVKVCYGKYEGQDCRMMTYRWTAPRVQRVCWNKGKSGAGPVKCYDRLTTQNYGSFVGTKAEWEQRRREEGGSRGGRN